MIVKFLLLLFLPIICDARIKINVTVASNKRDAIINFSGADNKLITQHEVALFNISTANLNKGIKDELGRAPDGIFLKDPTTYGNLFHKYKWPEIRRNIHIDKVKIDEIITKEVVFRVHEYVNHSTEDTLTKRSLFTDVENSAYSNWSAEGLPEENNIFYDVIINCDNTTLKYEGKWRDRSLKTSFVHMGRSDNEDVILKTGQGVIKNLTALKVIFVISIEYKAQLTGNLVLDYENLYGKYHFYAPTIDNIMKAGNIVNEIRTTERMEIRCYVDPKLNIYDRDSGAPIKRRKLYWKKYDKHF